MENGYGIIRARTQVVCIVARWSFAECASIFKFFAVAKSCVVPNNRKCSSNYQLSWGNARGWCLCLTCRFTLDLFATIPLEKNDDGDGNNKTNLRRVSELKYFICLAKTKRKRQCQQTRCLLFFHTQNVRIFFLFFCALKIIFIMLIHITPSNAFLSLSHGTRDIIFNVHVLDFVWVTAITAIVLSFSACTHSFVLL